jgi:tRNA pseudouridine38-40 synthase
VPDTAGEHTAAEPPRPGGSGASGRRRLRLDVAYDGSAFHGFAENAGVRTVAGELRAALERVLDEPVGLTCAGRTDTGVHAVGQVVTLDVERSALPPERLRDALNGLLRPQVAVTAAAEVAGDFDARFSACWRRYRYQVLSAPVHDPFLAETAWWVGEPLDGPAMDAAAQVLVGEHDFSSFCRRPRRAPEVSLVRRVHAAGWTAGPAPTGEGTLWQFEITASAFCHQMVRSIVGALVAVGRGRRTERDIAALLAARDRDGAPNLAPPQGLTLWQVGYQPWLPPAPPR